ncbi:copper chaperone PCu(A)C [Loktanella sp. Alg231-35]|uniref:copper chaperone PCu(A)C n=1 Tax=Loktanella sp. Alg231-35 TaxID=1922220 RepID=UPI000D553525|nr:copper chaperone PCu(A)C [Loktanella sp. Alg231-35]
MKTYSYAAMALLALSAPATAHEFKVGALVVDHPMAFETTATAMSGAGYLTVTNTGSTDDRLVAVEAAFPRVMIHTTTMQDGVASMSHVDAVDIPAGETVKLAPGGFHVMFMGLDGDPFEVGEAVPATLVFEQAGSLEVVFNVEARDAADMEQMDHSTHGTGN